jgi:hypothetical protein
VVVLAIFIAGFCVYGLVQVRRQAKTAPQPKDGDAKIDGR